MNDKRVIEGERQRVTGQLRPRGTVVLEENVAGLPPITRLGSSWQDECRAWKARALADCDYVYEWVDGAHLGVGLEDEQLCALVTIGARPDGTKEVIAVEDGYRESRAGRRLRHA